VWALVAEVHAQQSVAQPPGSATNPAAGNAAPAAPVDKIGTITVRFVGSAVVDEQVVRANMQIREGGDLDETALDRDIRTLYRTGLFEDARVIKTPKSAAEPNTYNLVVEVTPKYRVLAIRYEGNDKVGTSRLQQEVRSRPNLALDERQVKEDSEKIRDYYERDGYNQATVNYAIDRDRATGYATVTFQIREGAKVKIRQVNFTGNTHLSTRTLRKEMETKKYGLFSWALSNGRFRDDTFEDDLEKLRNYYREQGFLDVEIAPDEVKFDYPKRTRLVITVNVNEGRQYHVGEVTFVGNTIFQSDLLRRLVRQRTGMIFVPSKIDKDAETIQDFYGRDGYLTPDTYVAMHRRPNTATGNIDVEYEIQEGEKYKVESITIEGNTTTKSTAILRELPLGPGDVFSGVKMKIAKLTLENTRFFDTVDVTSENTNIPGRKNLKVSVREGRTGQLQFGAGFSSLDRASLFIEFAQGNFDLFNRHSFFKGDGQKFRLRLQLGSETSDMSLSFEEPWLFQQRLGLGFNLFRTTSAYDTTLYTEIHTGVNVYLRKRLNDLLGLDGRVDYTIEKVDITKVDAAASSFIRAQEGVSYVSRLGLQLTIDHRDRLINTTSGNRMELDANLAGGPLGGDRNYWSLEFRGSQYFPVFQAKTQVVSLIGRLGVMDGFGKTKEVPYYSRYFLGGPDDLRGFEYRDVGPKDASLQPIGGSSYGLFSSEYTIDIVPAIRFALFYDAGFVNLKPWDFNPGGFNDNYGISLRFFLAGAPVSLDYGIPITRDPRAQKGPQFNFSLGGRY
jgi:outer membrane protein insertion porin family